MLRKPVSRRWAVPAVLLMLLGFQAFQSYAANDQVADQAKGEVGAAESPPRLSEATARVEDFAWLAGTWRSSYANMELEEHWSAPLGDGLVGTFRWLRNGEVGMYELMAITKDKGRFLFRLKHFNRQFVGWEEKDEALTYGLTKIEPNKAVFEDPSRDQPRRFVFYRPVPETLIVRLEGFEDGEATEQEFQFSRVKP